MKAAFTVRLEGQIPRDEEWRVDLGTVVVTPDGVTYIEPMLVEKRIGNPKDLVRLTTVIYNDQRGTTTLVHPENG